MATATTDTFFTGTAGTAAPAERSLLFKAPDYVVFALSLFIPLAIGFFFFFYSLKSNSVENFLLGERSINFVAVALSILAALINGVFVIGTPAEMHYNGTTMTLLIVGLLIAMVITSHIFVVKYQLMTFTSAYEYVEKRFDYKTRVVASSLFCFSVIIFLAVVLYVPALAFEQVTHLSVYIGIVVTGVICTLYTTIGGMKAVVWTDAIQMVILLIGLVAIAILGSIKVGGGALVWEIAQNTSRINFDSFSAHPHTRHTVWTQIFGQGVVYLVVFISNQMMIQRYMAVSSSRKAQALVQYFTTLYIAFLMFIPLAALVIFIGLVVHAKYYECDPLVEQKIKSGDQIVPYFIMDLLGEYEGIPGLLIASVFAAAMSSVSSVINSLAAVILDDFITPAVWHFKKRKLEDRTQRKIAIGLVLFFGILTIALSFAASAFTSQLVQATGTIWGVIGGPLAGIFIMGFFMPFCNSYGAISGMIGGLIFTLWICVGGIVWTPPAATLPVGACGKFGPNVPYVSLPLTPPEVSTDPLMGLYKVSYAWYGVIGVGSCLVIAIPISILTGGCKKSYMRRSIDTKMMNLCCCTPKSPVSHSDEESYISPDVQKTPLSDESYEKVNNGFVGDQSEKPPGLSNENLLNGNVHYGNGGNGFIGDQSGQPAVLPKCRIGRLSKLAGPLAHGTCDVEVGVVKRSQSPEQSQISTAEPNAFENSARV